MTAKRALLPLFALALGLAACKQDEPPSIDSGLPPDKQGSDLTPAEQTQFCEAFVDFEAQLISPAEAENAACTAVGVAFALLGDGSVDTCNTVRQGCLDEPDMTTGGGSATCDLGIDWAMCMATVAEIEACREEYARESVAALKSLDCAKMAEYKAQPPSNEPPPLGEACSLAQAKCATVLSSPDMMMP